MSRLMIQKILHPDDVYEFMFNLSSTIALCTPAVRALGFTTAATAAVVVATVITGLCLPGFGARFVPVNVLSVVAVVVAWIYIVTGNIAPYPFVAAVVLMCFNTTGQDLTTGNVCPRYAGAAFNLIVIGLLSDKLQATLTLAGVLVMVTVILAVYSGVRWYRTLVVNSVLGSIADELDEYAVNTLPVNTVFALIIDVAFVVTFATTQSERVTITAAVTALLAILAQLYFAEVHDNEC